MENNDERQVNINYRYAHCCDEFVRERQWRFLNSSEFLLESVY